MGMLLTLVGARASTLPRLLTASKQVSSLPETEFTTKAFSTSAIDSERGVDEASKRIELG